MTLVEAWGFARGVEARVASAIGKYDQLGDDCDFLTLAGDWPFKYQVEEGEHPARGIYSLDDLVGRTLIGGPSLGVESKDQRGAGAMSGGSLVTPLGAWPERWGACFRIRAGRSFGTAYNGGTPWSTYAMKAATGQLSRGVARTNRALRGAEG